MVSIKATVMVVALIVVCLLATSTSAARHGCCESYTKIKVPFNAIKGYSVQTVTEFCRINAIIFYTKRGKAVCTDPALNWVMDFVNRLRLKAQKVHDKTSQAQK